MARHDLKHGQTNRITCRIIKTYHCQINKARFIVRVTLDRFTLKDYIKNFIYIYMYILSFNNNNKYI